MTLANVILRRFSSRSQVSGEPEVTQGSQYVLATPQLEQDVPVVHYLIIPIPEGPGECLHQIEVKYQEQGGLCGTMTAHMKNGLFLAVVLGLLTSAVLYAMSLAATDDIVEPANTTSSQDSNWTTPTVSYR